MATKWRAGPGHLFHLLRLHETVLTARPKHVQWDWWVAVAG